MVIGILAAITIVAYNGVQSRARLSALATDARNARTQLELIKTDTGSYPADASSLKKSPGTTYDYTSINNGAAFCIAAANPDVGAFFTASTGLNGPGPCPVGEWDFDGSTVDSTPLGNDGTEFSVVPVSDRNGIADSAYGFNGTSSYVSIPASAALPQAAGTVSAWVKLQDNGAVQNVIFYGSSGEDGCTGLPAISLATCGFVVQGDNGVVITPVPTLTDNQWHFIVGTWSGSSGKTEVYMDGTLRSSNALSFTPSFTQQVRTIGKPGSNSRYANGSIDQVHIYDRALSAAEIKQLYEAH